jgi:acetyl-CoA carboxylase biotin carboxylase subunit
MRRVLIANRGEIAVRIIRACRELGLETVAVYSEADRDALHVRLADDRAPIGPADARESYLDIGRVLDAARHTGADAVHPGYGFLAESSTFAAAVLDAGLTFIGPHPDVIARLGDKIAARRLARDCGVPTVPGYSEPDASDRALLDAAARLGFPLVVKAALGGGGRGMRFVARQEDLAAALEGARREAGAAFGAGALLLERHLEDVRHIEVQVLGGGDGDVHVLGERECSIQRRHQKIVEESPSPFVTPALREALLGAAGAVARAAGYTNAGTVEFLVEPTGRFYFLEVNTRLQVEHPVTEATTGVDLVKAQLRIAAGEHLRLAHVEPRGHAVECRVYAEDPSRAFHPSSGVVEALVEPSGPGVRIDSGLRQGWRVPSAYDPLLAKVIAWDATRDESIVRMRNALSSYVILGCATNIMFLQAIVGHEAFRQGETTTRFIDRHFDRWRPDIPGIAFAAAAAVESQRGDRWPETLPDAARDAAGAISGSPEGPWDRIGPWRMGMSHA